MKFNFMVTRNFRQADYDEKNNSGHPSHDSDSDGIRTVREGVW